MAFISYMSCCHLAMGMFIKKISGRKHLLEFPNSGEGGRG